MPRLVADLTPLRRHPAFRRLWIGQLVSATGSQLTVVALAYQAYELTHSTLIVGLVSLAQLLPLLFGSVWGGAVADAHDLRRLLVVAQLAMAAASAGLAGDALSPRPALWPLFLCSCVAAAWQGTDNPGRRAAIAMLVPPEDLTPAVSLLSVTQQVSLVVGPALGGVAIGLIGLGGTYLVDVASFAVSLSAAIALPRLVPAGRGGAGVGLRAVVEGVRYLGRARLLAATYWIDLDAMVFGMPRAVFPALGTGVFHGGSGTVGLLYAAPGAGALAGSLLTGWVRRIRHQGRAVVACVAVWGAAIAAFGVAPWLAAALGLLAVAGAADVYSAVMRQAILLETAPPELRGRLSGTFFAVVAGGPRLGDIETGVAADLAGPRVAVWSGGLACLAGIAVVLWRFGELWRQGVAPISTAASDDAVLAGRLEAGTELDEHGG